MQLWELFAAPSRAFIMPVAAASSANHLQPRVTDLLRDSAHNADQIIVRTYLIKLSSGRYDAEPYVELRVAAAEQMKITELRLAKLLESTRGTGRGPAGPPLGAGGVDAHPTAGDAASAARTPSGREAAATGFSPAVEPAGAAARRAGRLRAHFVQPGGLGVVASPTAASPGVLPHRVILLSAVGLAIVRFSRGIPYR